METIRRAYKIGKPILKAADRYAGRMTDQARPARQRRRGEELEAALLEAAWDELVEAGFAKLTMESVAARARTSVTVLYRRWSGKDELVLAAARHFGTTHRLPTPDTGSLRGDMVALLEGAGTARIGFTAVVSAAFSGLLAGTGLTPAEVREKIMPDGPLRSQEVFDRAHARGEIDLETIPAAVLTMPFDLMRHDMLMNYAPIPPERVRAIVDDLFLPLVTARRPG